MANIRRWSVTATGNATVAGGANTINFAEGQSPGSVNNSAREMMAQIRSIYQPDEWGWVEHSATASVASQTTFKLAGNQTTAWAANRRWKLKSGSTTRYGTVVSSSFTTETTITVTVDSGSLSASHSLAALSVVTTNHVPADYVSSNSVSAMITVRVPQAVSTSSTPQFAGIEVGNASDTTLARASAGQLSVEGVQIATASNTLTLTNKTINASQIVDASITPAKLSGAQSGSAPAYVARAWVNFNGTGVVAIRGSGNVTSITDNGTGDYTINFTTAMSDANYAVTLTGGDNTDVNYRVVYVNSTTAPTTSAVRIQCISQSGGNPFNTDHERVSAAIFR